MAQSNLTFATGQSARLVIGQPQFDALSSTATQTTVGGVSGLAYVNNTLFAADGNLVGAPPVNNRVLIFQNINQQLPAFNAAIPYDRKCPVCVGEANVVLGQPDFTTTTPTPCIITQTGISTVTTPTTPTCPTGAPQTPLANGMRVPTAVASDGTHLAVADTYNNRVLIWNSIPTTNNKPPDVVVGQTNFTTASFPGATPTASSLRGPQGVWIQGGKLYIADTQNDRILIYNSIPTSNGASADVVLGQPNMTTYVQVNIAQQNTSATASNMLTPVSVTSDGVKLFVTDLGFNRVMIWNTIPASNNASADVVVGQPDTTSGTPNNAFTATTSGSTTTETPVLCKVSNGVDTNNNKTYPSVCEYTLSFPRFALSDGTKLYIADGGNDRILIYNHIPTSNGAPADVVLGQTDFTSNTPTGNADSMSSPLSLAFDGNNLYIADSYNQRILVYSESQQSVPYNAIRNAASLNIYALGTVTIGGTIKSGDKVTVNIGINTSSATPKAYTYTVQSGDTFASVINALVALINAGKGDPYVLATADDPAAVLVLTAKTAGTDGNNITLSTTLSSSAQLTAVVSGATLSGGGSAAAIAPGTVVTITGTNLSEQAASAPNNNQPLPTTLGGVQVYFNGVLAPLMYVSPTQINAQVPFEFGYEGTGTANAWVRIKHSDGTYTATNAVAISLVQANPGLFAQNGKEPRQAIAYHSSSYATGLISVDGTVKAGNIGSICIGASDALTATSTTPSGGCSGGRIYNYKVQSGDTLYSVRDAFVALMRNDPQVVAIPSSQFTRILLQAKKTGTAGNGIPFQVAVNTGASLLLTAVGPAPPSPGVGGLLCCANTAGAPVTLDNPAVPGETIIFYATGLGTPVLDPQVNKYVITGHPYQGPSFNVPGASVSALTDGKTANVGRAELAPGLVGVYQVYMQLEPSLTTDPLTQVTIAQNTYVSNVVSLPVFATSLLSSLTCSPTTLNSGGVATCTATLSVAVPSGPTTIDLSSSSSLLAVGTSVTIPAGSTSATFTATAGTISSSTTAKITAKLGSETSSVSFTLNP